MPKTHQLLLIEDDPSFAKPVCRNLNAKGYAVDHCDSAEAALKRLTESYYDLVVTDVRLPGQSGIDVLRQIKNGEAGVDAELPVVVVTSVDSVETAVEAMRLGAADYVTKESEIDEIVVRVAKAIEQSRVANENRFLRAQLARSTEFDEIIGVSSAMQKIKDELAEVAGSDVSVLIVGETGSGKELVARAIHRTGAHPDGPFVEVNCAALPDENLFQSEVFGHEKGAFTGATQRKQGRFELADGGTLFLDELGELPMESQAKILRAIETSRFSRIGGSQTIHVDCRFIFATNRDLSEEVKEGRFREDLYYRVNIFPILVPPLRERPDDVAPLIRYFVDQFADKYSRPRLQIGDEALKLLRDYRWPGNIRELRNVAERLVIRARDGVIDVPRLEACGIGRQTVTPSFVIPDEGVDLEDVERRYVIAALEKANWNQKLAAKLLGISPDRVNARVKKFGLTNPSWRVHK